MIAAMATERPAITVDELNRRSQGRFPGHVGLVVTALAPGEVQATLAVAPQLMAPNGFLHAGALVTLADTCCGYGCMASLPADASGFTTIELKSNHLATTREGTVLCVARALHLGGTTQVWDATVSLQGSGKVLALFRCTQLVLRAR